ncbi:ATP synthase mitochondrial F1 complex assembly factor 2 [Trichinella pseudospiralis]|uniref:ATP synthase mitochondrial F1 complex assembly factor 2 n=1 Tax=Trichinella pseudospiralis TaxID=6337 RepID=A0A0V1FA18_TRIPS|nr:ATP synthase mitochondrial F1 complex assembly factor 2 [Trichinella pseudospiralis]KRZ40901.1 ATP synthase mitochondrial F1 complex assembly factor 2 [Trichinella pseudospiralis]
MQLRMVFGRCFATRPISRFYKSVDVMPVDVNRFSIHLDQRPLKTPKGRILTVDSEPLALCIAVEWSSQRANVDLSRMHLTTLCFTAIDNPNQLTNGQLVDDLLKHLESDTIFFINDQLPELGQIQKDKWYPIIQWATHRFDVSLATPSLTMFAPTLAASSVATMRQFFLSRSWCWLLGCKFAVESLNSVLLTLAACEHRLDVVEAVNLATLERQFQISRWGRIEWAHDLEELEVRCRVSAGLLFAMFACLE